MKTLRLILVLLIGLVAIKAWSLDFAPVPDALLKEAGDVPIIYQGSCAYQKKQQNCMVGYDKATKTTWLLLFTEEGVLYKVETHQNGKAKVKWTHPALTV